jgi:hypothetical protein
MTKVSAELKPAFAKRLFDGIDTHVSYSIATLPSETLH